MFGTKHLKINKCQTNQQSTKYSNINKETKLLGNTKYNQVKLLLVVFASAYLYQVSIKLHWANSITLDMLDFNKHLTID